jgi:hypothetical protein
VNDRPVVSRGEAVSDLHRVVDGRPHRERAGCQSLAERLTLEQLGHDVRGAIVLADIEDRQNVRVIQCCSGPGFLFEPT